MTEINTTTNVVYTTKVDAQALLAPTVIPEIIERMADDRYKVVPSHESMLHRWAVVAGGTQQLYLGREVECQNMARKFAGAFLDGAFVAMQQRARYTYAAGMGDPLVTAAPAAVAGPSEAVAYLDIGTGGYLDLGTDLTDEAQETLPQGKQ